MNAIRNTIWNRRLPSFIGFFFLVGALATITWLSRNAIIFGTKAALSNDPQNITISNITDTSFTVSYVTDDKVIGTITYGKNQTPDLVAIDDRDQKSGAPTPYGVHHITARNLTPSTQYFFTVTSGDKTFSHENVPYEVTTGPTLTDTKPSTALLSGKIVQDDGSIPQEALVYMSASTSQVFSNIVGTDGSYNIALELLRTKDLSAIDTLADDAVLTLLLADPKKQSHVSLLASQSNPVPLVTLSKDYNFAVSDLPLFSPSASTSATPAIFPENDDAAGSTSPQILTPNEDQTFKDQQPLFKGKAVPNAEVEITIQSDQKITTTISANDNGNWQYRPTVPLAPGTHTITIRTLDASGIIKTITQSFTVYAEGSQFTEPSLSPTESPTPQPNQTGGPTRKPTATPTLTPSPTKIPPTATPTKAPTKPVTTISVVTSPTKIVSPTATKVQPPVPITGNTSLVFSIIAVISIVGVGALLFFLTAL